MTTIKDHHCLACNAELTSPSPVETWMHGTAVNGGLTVEFRAGVGSEFVDHTFAGVICDACLRTLANQQGRLTAYYPEIRGLPNGMQLVDGQAEPVIEPPLEG